MDNSDPRVESGETQKVTAKVKAESSIGIGWIAALPPLVLALVFATGLPAIADGETLRFVYEWVPSAGINLTFLVDGLSLTFALLIAGIGAVVALFSSVTLAGHVHYWRFVFYLLFFMFAMLGLVLADNLITLFVFWELTSVASYLLIGFNHSTAKARRSALQALLVTGGGGLALLAGFILLGSAAGTYELSEIMAMGDTIRDHALYLPIFFLVLAGAFTKSAQVPFHFWLPNAMAAPTPVSAYLHSATMVKGGIYLLARMHPALSGTEVWLWTLTLFGAVTAVFASVLALRQTDLKLALAYTTLMALGTLTMFLGSGATIAIAAAVTFLIVHSFYKAALFLIVGIIDYRAGTRETSELGGLAKTMPVTAFAAAAAALSMAGFPPFLGFIGKELKYEGALAVASEPLFVATAAVLANALMVAIAGIVALKPFYGPRLETPKSPREAPLFMWIGPLGLAVLGLVFGLMPGLISASLVQPAVTAIAGQPEEVKLALWHGLNLPLLLSVVTFVLGISFYLGHQKLRGFLVRVEQRLPATADQMWDRFLDGLKASAAWQTRILQGGILRRYLFVVFATTALGGVVTLYVTDAARWPEILPDFTIKHLLVVGLIAGGAIMTVFAGSRLAAICALGVVGMGVALIFVIFGAPDVAITQLLVETLVVILVAVVMLRLPSLERDPMKGARIFDAILALFVGGVVTVILLSVLDTPLDRTITAYFEEKSMPEAFGRNIVNVILVDFRALDTFGEIAVVAVAALGAYVLIKGTKKAKQQ
ncbi:putative monovalent cation/H+ antiporter subunit A [Denitrobaculum tricleocarpae]|uniref:Putative monovalent cation/H+ antiporter subunit A n=1 Tax=Denitrobaculum tricleocarpae TaxID=2591009 RepID=A0A545TMU4_9PROT|nr:putative monovalent cation/H+ antiporter subunit A [Denitrobaculum tricleocarpae]TQV78498.1 putative monovalent cation/H+ antiporter subunit A [Denitrobaculum tricleocarpae]